MVTLLETRKQESSFFEEILIHICIISEGSESDTITKTSGTSCNSVAALNNDSVDGPTPKLRQDFRTLRRQEEQGRGLGLGSAPDSSPG